MIYHVFPSLIKSFLNKFLNIQDTLIIKLTFRRYKIYYVTRFLHSYIACIRCSREMYTYDKN